MICDYSLGPCLLSQNCAFKAISLSFCLLFWESLTKSNISSGTFKLCGCKVTEKSTIKKYDTYHMIAIRRHMHLSIIFLLITVQPLTHYQMWFFDFPQNRSLNTSFLIIVAKLLHLTSFIL